MCLHSWCIFHNTSPLPKSQLSYCYVLFVYFGKSLQSISFSGLTLHTHLGYIISLKASKVKLAFAILLRSVTQSQTNLAGLAVYKK